jgi:hypothetical protein
MKRNKVDYFLKIKLEEKPHSRWIKLKQAFIYSAYANFPANKDVTLIFIYFWADKINQN